MHISSVADPGFPVGGGGAPTRWGGCNLRHIHFSTKTYAKTKEMDPFGGARRRRPPGSANDIGTHIFFIQKIYTFLL